jgi:DNA helicase IV
LSIVEHNRELTAERAYIDMLYRRLDAERSAAADRLSAALLDSGVTNQQARWQREVIVDTATQRVSRLRVADNGLCFGRIAGREGDPRYIGRIGLFDDDGGYEPLLTDWRAPAARPFYCATGASPDGVAVRRHFHTTGRQVRDFHDEVLDLALAGNGETDADAALLAALNAPRERTMRDIVATIQGEQDAVIRLDPAGVLVIEGGPGTGKTAVAMHRVAYLLYTERDRLSRRGVLVVGPNARFLDYIGEVLPSLGETAVVFATPGELLPGLRTALVEKPDVRRLKGDVAMAGVLAAAVADRQELPAVPIRIDLGDGKMSLDSDLVAAARERARTSGLRHNPARTVFRDALMEAVAARIVAGIDASWLAVTIPATGAAAELEAHPVDPGLLTAELAAEVRVELLNSPPLADALDQLWPLLTPQRLLTDLYASADRLAATGLSEADAALLRRDPGAPWTVSDVPLLDEAAELLGPLSAERAPTEPDPYARKVLEMLTLDVEETDDEEFAMKAVDLLDARALSDRHATRDQRELAERAMANREWTYGHVVVDEAQELSAMDWRLLMRRCPSRSLTAVGDLAQRGSAAGARSWAEVFEPYVSDRWRYRELSVNYRTTAEIMDLAARVLPERPQPRSVRSGPPPWTRRVDPAELASAVQQAAKDEAAQVAGTVAVIAPESLRIPGALTPTAAKGLEFDAVIVVEPATIAAENVADLYVALTRPTQRLGILHTAEAPPQLLGVPVEE